MIAAAFDREEHRQAWFDFSCALVAGIQQLGWNEFGHLPEPRENLVWNKVKYWDRWRDFAAEHEDELLSSVRHWCNTGEWLQICDTVRYLAQLRYYTTIRFIDRLYVGPGRHGETIIPFPQHLNQTEHLSWWLIDWFCEEGSDELCREMSLRFWTKRKCPLSPGNRKLLPSPRPLWESPKYHLATDPMI